jgi:hypothetical protein
MSVGPDRARLPSARLLLCFPSLSFAGKALRSGVDLWVVADRGQRSAFTAFAADRLILVDAGDQAAAGAVAEVVRRHGITHVLDADGFPATRVCPDFASAAHVLADDRRLAKVLAPSRHPLLRSRVAVTAADVPEAVAELGPPAVIRGDGAETVVRSAGALAEWVRGRGGRGGPFTVGEFVAGPEVVVTTLTHDGMHRVVGITAKRAVAHGLRYLHPATLSEAEARQVRATVTAMLDLVGYEFGPAETWVVLSPQGPRIRRARPGFGTTGIRRLIEVAAGFDTQTELFRALAGVPIRPPEARWFAGADVAGPSGGWPAPGPRVVAEGATPELVEERLDAARRCLQPSGGADRSRPSAP